MNNVVQLYSKPLANNHWNRFRIPNTKTHACSKFVRNYIKFCGGDICNDHAGVYWKCRFCGGISR